MITRTNPKNNDQLSQLAFGCMRFDRDETKTEQQILYAVEHGVNYFDTAYIYPNSEATLGRILAKHNLREKIKLATKVPPYLIRKSTDFDKYFDVQLERLKTDYIDYYLIHFLTDVTTLNKIFDLGFKDWVYQKKQEGKIINIGFSYHGDHTQFSNILDSYDWDFCMIQYNYLDEFNQASVKGLKKAHSMGIPVIIMEPLRGGRLVRNLPVESINAFNSYNEKRSPAEWSFRWLWNHPEITTVLSGMNSLEMVQENIRVANLMNANTMSQEELDIVQAAKDGLLKATRVYCTGCNYCMPCPAGVDIPLCFAQYNELDMHAKPIVQFDYLMRTHKKNASKCIECGKCETHCPQKIQIRNELKKVKKEFEGGLYKPASFILRKIIK